MSRRQPKPNHSSKNQPQSTSFDAYINALKERLSHYFEEDPEFKRCVDGIDSLYRAGNDPTATGPNLARILLICHRSMFSAGALIAMGQPDVADAVSRRAIEAAKVALAMKLDPTNGQQWLALEQRQERWDSRRSGAKPGKPVSPKYELLNKNPLAEALNVWLGILSDRTVHFTPEFVSQMNFQDYPSSVYLEYLNSDASETARAITSLAAIHIEILKAIDFCTGGRLDAIDDYRNARNDLTSIARGIQERYGLGSGAHQSDDS